MKRSDFHYDLPPELIAQTPLPERSASRLLVVPPAPAPLQDRGVRDLPDLLRAGDLLVFNDTRVIPARLFGQKASGGRVEILIERLLPGSEARAQVGASKSPKAGSRIALDAGGDAEVLGREGEFYRLRFHVDRPLEVWLEHAGRLPLPPYIHRDADASDDARYQTVFARETGAVAAPTAGLHFDESLLDALRARGAIREDALGIGVDVDADCRAIGADGAASETLSVIGPVTRGTFWESVAVPDIRAQAARVAARLTT